MRAGSGAMTRAGSGAITRAGSGEPAAPRPRSLLRSQARCALTPGATPRDVLGRRLRLGKLKSLDSKLKSPDR
jgi:hypothetical protein